jgi:alpha-tubulin suppressor-like RCC1 family protein
VSALSMATGISAGNDATCAIRGDGTVRCWGRGTDGQLGNGLGTSSATPVLVSSAGGALARARIAAGWYTSCALTPQGSIYCWGRNQDGELGIGTSSPYSTTPVQVPFLYAADVAVGVDHVCALRMGSVSCWGNNDEGQLGTGDQVDRYSPTFVPGITQVVAITAGYQHTCALVAAGNVWCWGRNLSGQIGDGNPIGTVSHYLSPIRVGPPGGHPLGNVVTISARAEGTCAVLANGTVQCWGLNSSGQLGDGTTTSRSTPAPVLGLSGVTAISAAGIAQACVVLDDGQARCWGDNGFGQLGDGTSTSSSSPVAVANVTHAVDIAVHGSHACVLQSDARVWCWGNNTSGQLGNGTTIGSNVPVLAGNPLTTVVSLVAGQNHTCIVHVDGSAQCWGDDAHGELGVGDTAQRLWPTDVVSFP